VSRLQKSLAKHLLLDFFFGFVVDLDPFVALLPLVDLETLAAFVAPFGVALGTFGATFDPSVEAFEPFVRLAFCRSLANNLSTEAQPDAAKIRLIVGESSLISALAAVAADVDVGLDDGATLVDGADERGACFKF